MGKVLTDEEREKRMAEDIWLNYFNRYLFEHGTISEKEYKRIKTISRKGCKVSVLTSEDTARFFRYINAKERFWAIFDFGIAL